METFGSTAYLAVKTKGKRSMLHESREYQKAFTIRPCETRVIWSERDCPNSNAQRWKATSSDHNAYSEAVGIRRSSASRPNHWTHGR